jgi:hypothetical protein
MCQLSASLPVTWAQVDTEQIIALQTSISRLPITALRWAPCQQPQNHSRPNCTSHPACSRFCAPKGACNASHQLMEVPVGITDAHYASSRAAQPATAGDVHSQADEVPLSDAEPCRRMVVPAATAAAATTAVAAAHLHPSGHNRDLIAAAPTAGAAACSRQTPAAATTGGFSACQGE